MSDDLVKAILELIEASRPFTGGDVVDETSGTIPLMDRLEEAISQMESALISERDK